MELGLSKLMLLSMLRAEYLELLSMSFSQHRPVTIRSMKFDFISHPDKCGALVLGEGVEWGGVGVESSKSVVQRIRKEKGET